jgi:hypothetical protein
VRDFVKYPAILILLFITHQCYAQRPKIENLPNFDQRRYHFGFTIGFNSADFILKRYELEQFDSLLTVEPVAQPGFQLGIIGDLHITPQLNLRFLPSLSFMQRNIDYTFINRPVNGGPATRLESKAIESTFLELPLLIKYRSARLNNFASYIVAGFNYRLDLVSQEDVVFLMGEETVRLRRHDFTYEIGIGFDFFLDYFKFSPELRLCIGIPDVTVRDGTIWTNPLSRLSSRIFVLSFHFEG